MEFFEIPWYCSGDKKRKENFFYSGTDSFKIRKNPSVDYIIQIYAVDASGMTLVLDYTLSVPHLNKKM